MNTFLTTLFALIFAILFTSTQVSAQDRPIFMNRREDSFGDILTELKGKGLGGRMRFGKRSAPEYFDAYRSVYEPRVELVAL